ncbi:hypothetical protein Poli38472_000540 [Pythium oligandrum]|uniref:FYVE-type domain-containing protein n=1 Tax=Pythium oligandrum TaxID=41045 RepID=A0A8K1CCI4_PYTOL|nr:hypothetical protein Poli38472_000540 [Pythium oligandrum]|eukprot:TMW60498.1 hypothetical protein Poli38472_000540 [Pythium oligandrum]
MLSATETTTVEEMSPREKERLTSVAKSMTESLLETTDLLGGVPWFLVHEKAGISLFRADVGNDVPCNVHAVCKFNSDIEDVANSMITTTTDSYKNMMSMLSSDFIDGAIVENIVEPTEANPYRYVALKWAAYKSSRSFGKDRDFVLLEYVDMIEDDQGQKIAFRIMESVDVPNNSPYAESSRYTRDIVPLVGYMYHTTKKAGELRLTYTCNFDKNGDLPAWAANSAIQSHVEKCINGLLKYIESYRTSQEEIVLPQQQVIPVSEQDHCRLCTKNFCLVRRKHNCLKCGEVICSNCSRLRTAIVPDVGERQLRVCTACALAVRRSSRSPLDGTLPLTANGGDEKAQAAVGRTQSYSTDRRQRRVVDDLLDPVRSRLIEYKNFADAPDAGVIPKANFPGRSFSDGLIMRKGSLFGNKRRGSPADLAISIEAFRQHQLRMGNSEQQPEDGDQSDEEAMNQLRYFSSSLTSSSTNSSASSHPTVDEVLAPLQAMQPDIEHGPSRKQHQVRQVEYESSHSIESRARLNAAMELASGIIEQAKYANSLAQHARRVSHHRVLAIQREEVFMSVRNDNSDDDGRQAPETDNHSRRVVYQVNNGAMLYGKLDRDPRSS